MSSGLHNGLVGSWPLITKGLWEKKYINISLLGTKIRHIQPQIEIKAGAITVKQSFNIWTCHRQTWGGKWGLILPSEGSSPHISRHGSLLGQKWGLRLVTVAKLLPHWWPNISSSLLSELPPDWHTDIGSCGHLWSHKESYRQPQTKQTFS